FVSPSPPHRIFFLTTYTPFSFNSASSCSPTSFSSVIFFHACNLVCFFHFSLLCFT
ncbi:unnamed protein product, partial [Brassica oleracea var. botrytis]